MKFWNILVFSQILFSFLSFRMFTTDFQHFYSLLHSPYWKRKLFQFAATHSRIRILHRRIRRLFLERPEWQSAIGIARSNGWIPALCIFSPVIAFNLLPVSSFLPQPMTVHTVPGRRSLLAGGRHTGSKCSWKVTRDDSWKKNNRISGITLPNTHNTHWQTHKTRIHIHKLYIVVLIWIFEKYF